MRPIVVKFGLISGVILSLMMLGTLPFMDQIGFENGMFVGYTTMVLAFLMIYFGVRSYRDSVGGGTVKFGRAFAIGLLITCVASACYVATWELIYYKISPGFTEKYTEYTLEKAKAEGASDAVLAARAKEMAEFAEMYKNPLVNIAITFLEPLPVGLVFTLVTAGIMSRKRKEAHQPAVA